MNQGSVFNTHRFYYCLKREVALHGDTWMGWFGTIAGILLLLPLGLQIFSNSDGDIAYRVIGVFLFFLLGLTLASQTFREVHEEGIGLFFLTRPASHLEKFVAGWLTRTIGYIITAFIFLTGYSFLVKVIAEQLIGITEWQAFNPFEHDHLKVAGHLLVWQSLFMFGSLYFKKNHFMKTCLALFGLFIFISIWTILFSHLFAYAYIGIESYKLVMAYPGDVNMNLVHPSIDWLDLGVTVLYWLSGPFFLLVSYFRLKEQEL